MIQHAALLASRQHCLEERLDPGDAEAASMLVALARAENSFGTRLLAALLNRQSNPRGSP
jgi:hypothetical protein